MTLRNGAQLYGVGNRLDREPELFFKLRQVDHLELIAQAAQPAPKVKGAGRKTIAKDQLADVFGIELETENETAVAPPRKPAKSPRSKMATAPAKKKTVHGDGGSAPEGSPVANGKPAGSRRKTLTAAARKRIAEAQLKRWQTLRRNGSAKEGKGNGPSFAPAARNKNRLRRSPFPENPRAGFALCEWHGCDFALSVHRRRVRTGKDGSVEAGTCENDPLFGP